MGLTKRISLYTHALVWIGLLFYTVYFRLTYHLIEVPADYIMRQNRFFANVNIVLTILYALYIIRYGLMLSKSLNKSLHIANIMIGIIVTLRAAFMASLQNYVVVNSVVTILFIYQIVFSYGVLKTSHQEVNYVD